MKRTRGNNEGSVYQRKGGDGRWVAAMGYIDADGIKRRKSWYGATREEAAEKLKKGSAQLVHGFTPTDDRLTVGKFLTDWLENTARPSVRPSTFESYRDYVHLHLVPSLGKHKLSRLAPAHVEQMLREMTGDLNSKRRGREDRPLSPRTANHARAVLRAALNFALKNGLVHRNAAALATPLRVQRHETPVLTPEQASAFVEAMRSPSERLGPLFTFALATGLRQGECLGLRWSDVELGDGAIRVSQAYQRSLKEGRFVEPKSPTSRRAVVLPLVVREALRTQKVRQNEERLKAGPHWTDTGLVFTSAKGTPLNPSSTTRTLRETLRRLDLPELRFHDLRHSCATLLLTRGVHPKLVAETLGHSSVSLTLNTYSHVIPALGKEVAAQMDQALSR